MKKVKEKLMEKFNNMYSLEKILKLQMKIKKFLNNRRGGNNNGEKFSNPQQGQLGVYQGRGSILPLGLMSNTNFEYVGGKNNGEKEGFGVQKWKDGAIYKGKFNKNRANGLGIFKHSDGDEYKGEFVNDRASGYGLYRHSNGATYEGMWTEDSQHGFGEEKWRDGSEYVGNYIKGKKQGLGNTNFISFLYLFLPYF
jgi:hypothetical protein